MADRNFDVIANYGIDVFDDEQMRIHLPSKVYKELTETIRNGKPLDASIADDVAHGMKEWALSKGATHYTHWFQPLSGVTAEKHDSFISAPDESGKVLMSFSGKELIKGEPDASSFPSGGLRATFEARGYTAWDCTSPAFVIHDENASILYIPTAFCSYTGESLDEKTPLLRSMDYLSEQAIRVLKIFGDNKTQKIICRAGPEQEYFLIDENLYAQRKDLIYTGRTLFGAMAPKGQELEDHYFGHIKEKVEHFMSDVNEALWKLGIPAKTEHNEVAPSQHEVAVIYSQTNIATDQNALVMMILKKVAKKHGLVCLLAEKPFDGINGSGKHNNWSISKDDGTNLFKPGKNPIENTQFLVFLAALVKAVDENAGLMRASVASYTNDFRLGANEAPPAIVSMFLGDELDAVVEAIINGSYSTKKESVFLTGAKTLPTISRDSTDRNRTSPFAFTGNRFEFRMVGSLQSVADPNTTLNAIYAKSLKEFADEICNAENVTKAINDYIRRTLTEHRRVIFNGDGYSDAWVEEAKRRGLLNLRTAVEAYDQLRTPEAKEVFGDGHIFTPSELESRAAIRFDNYSNLVMLDAKTMSHMAHKQYLPKANEYLTFLGKEAKTLAASGIKTPKSTLSAADKISALIDEASDAADKVDALILEVKKYTGRDKAYFAKDKVIPALQALRAPIDALELIVSKEYWPVPSYGDLLYYIG